MDRKTRTLSTTFSLTSWSHDTLAMASDHECSYSQCFPNETNVTFKVETGGKLMQMKETGWKFGEEEKEEGEQLGPVWLSPCTGWISLTRKINQMREQIQIFQFHELHLRGRERERDIQPNLLSRISLNVCLYRTNPQSASPSSSSFPLLVRLLVH